VELVTKASATFQNFLADPEMTWFRNNIGNASGVLVIPKFIKAGFVFGGAGGQGALVTRDKESGEWLGPVFYNLGGASIGLQVGVDISEMVLLVMTENGTDALLSNEFKLGADARVAAGPVGAGAGAATADVYAFSRSKGLFAGVSVEGSVISPARKLNDGFYGPGTNPSDVLVRRTAHNPEGAGFVNAVASTAQ
ncbi:MAG: lipid-binding SYLF domain-containing protein, partial [Pseudomonadota bacterium]